MRVQVSHGLQQGVAIAIRRRRRRRRRQRRGLRVLRLRFCLVVQVSIFRIFCDRKVVRLGRDPCDDIINHRWYNLGQDGKEG